MAGPFSAYRALELEPGADRAAVEAAYRRLIKLHHPDRSGGDARRAAEINRAYFELRSQPAREHEPIVSGRGHSTRRRRRRGGPWLTIAIAAIVLLVAQRDRLTEARQWVSRLAEIASPAPATTARSRSTAAIASLDSPLAAAAIDRSVNDAIRLVARRDDRAVALQSRDCHRRLRADPGLTQFDRCAAFDSAVAALEDRDPDRDSGPFNASSLTARQMTAASLLSNDYLAIERRLNRVRNRVEMALAPAAAPRLEATNMAAELAEPRHGMEPVEPER